MGIVGDSRNDINVHYWRQFYFSIQSWRLYQIYERIAITANELWCDNHALMVTNDGRCWNDARFIFVHNSIPGIYISDGTSVEPFVEYRINKFRELENIKPHVDIIKDFSYIRFINHRGSWQQLKDEVLRDFSRLKII